LLYSQDAFLKNGSSVLETLWLSGLKRETWRFNTIWAC